VNSEGVGVVIVIDRFELELGRVGFRYFSFLLVYLLGEECRMRTIYLLCLYG